MYVSIILLKNLLCVSFVHFDFSISMLITRLLFNLLVARNPVDLFMTITCKLIDFLCIYSLWYTFVVILYYKIIYLASKPPPGVQLSNGNESFNWKCIFEFFSAKLLVWCLLWSQQEQHKEWTKLLTVIDWISVTVYNWAH